MVWKRWRWVCLPVRIWLVLVTLPGWLCQHSRNILPMYASLTYWLCRVKDSKKQQMQEHSDLPLFWKQKLKFPHESYFLCTEFSLSSTLILTCEVIFKYNPWFISSEMESWVQEKFVPTLLNQHCFPSCYSTISCFNTNSFVLSGFYYSLTKYIYNLFGPNYFFESSFFLWRLSLHAKNYEVKFVFALSYQIDMSIYQFNT